MKESERLTSCNAKDCNEKKYGRYKPYLAIWRTYLLFRKCGKEKKDESGKRPITSLNTFYKIVSAIVAKNLRNYVKEKNLYSIQQRGGIEGNMGCKEEILIDGAIHRSSRS